MWLPIVNGKILLQEEEFLSNIYFDILDILKYILIIFAFGLISYIYL